MVRGFASCSMIRFDYQLRSQSRFVQRLFGVAHASGSGFGTSSTSIAVGGVDVKLFQCFSWYSAQVEYLLTRFPETTTNRETQNTLRVSGGVVFHL